MVVLVIYDMQSSAACKWCIIYPCRVNRQARRYTNKEALPRVQSHGPLDLVKRVPNTFIGQSLAYGWKQVNKANELNRYKREGEVVRTG